MKSFLLTLACVAALGTSVPAMAQTAPDGTASPAPAPDKQWSDITEVVIRAKAPGPAMWRLRRGDSTVWVMGVLHVSPDDVFWDAGRFRRVLTGAHALILPRLIPETEELTKVDVELPAPQQLRDVVSASAYDHLQTILKRENISDLPTRLEPAWAGVWLLHRVYVAHHINSRIVPSEVVAYANQSGVAVKYVDRHTDQVQARQYFFQGRDIAEACLNDYLDSIDHDLATASLMGKAWATGDVPTILAHHQDPAWVTCFLSQPKYASIYQGYAVDDMVKTVDDALKTPGKSVAVMPLSDLLRKNGILDRLRAEGVEITSPLE